MNTENFEQIAVNAADVGDTLKFVKENEMVKILSYEGEVFGIEPPLFVELEITETEPGFAGNTATGATSLRQALRYLYLYSSTRAKLSKSTQEQANTSEEQTDDNCFMNLREYFCIPFFV